MFYPYHFGLFFTSEHVQQARQYADRSPFAGAYEALKRPALGWASSLQIKGLRYRFLDDHQAAVEVIRALERDFLPAPAEKLPLLRLIAETIITAQAFEMVRDHPARQVGWAQSFLSTFGQRVEHLHTLAGAEGYVASLWQALMNTVAGVVLEDEQLFERGIAVYRHTIENDISPRGFIEMAVSARDGGSMDRTVYAVSALVLIAEAASHVGVNVWDYQMRGVSLLTAALYPIYYFYVTDQWQWDDLEPEHVQDVFRRHGGYLEIVNRRSQPRDFKPLLEDLRPISDAWAGGVTTLTHGVLPRRGLFR